MKSESQDHRDNNKKKYILALNMIPHVGFKRASKLIEHFGGEYENIFKIPPKTLAEIAGIRKNLSYNPKETLDKAEKELEHCEKNNVNIISITDDIYPRILKEINSPPIILYCKGDINCLNNISVSIVGTRRPSHIGIRNATNLSKALVKYNLMITSGFAKGIDSAAHEGAIAADGKTCAVLGCGVDIMYPASNKKLKEKIIETGCMISEFPMGTPPIKTNFPQRNRIIAGLSRACVMVEGALDSGSLITANMAFNMNRSVFAYPGPIDNPLYEGSNSLIKKNIAGLISSHSDLIEELMNILDLNTKKQHIKELLKEKTENLSEIEKKVLKTLDELEAKHIDSIIEQTKETPSSIGQILLSLELKGLVIQKPGKLFLRS